MKQFFLCLFLIAGSLSAKEESQSWMHHWLLGLEKSQQADYPSAVKELTVALDNLGKNEASKYLYIYNERAKAFFKMGQINEALTDFLQVLSESGKSRRGQPSDSMTALWGCASCYALLNDSEHFLQTYDFLYQFDFLFPKVELFEKYLVIRNVDFKGMSEAMRNAFCCALIHAEMCTSASDITFFDQGVCVIKRLCHCGCKGCFARGASFACESCGQSFLRQAQEGATDNQSRNKKVLKTAFVMSTNLPSFVCLPACTAIVESLIQAAYWQSDSADFYERCVAPFQQINLE